MEFPSPKKKEKQRRVNKIRLETNFFNAVRNTVRILLQDYSNLSIREEIENIINSKMTLYRKKLEEMVSLIKKLVETLLEALKNNLNKDLLLLSYQFY